MWIDRHAFSLLLTVTLVALSCTTSGPRSPGEPTVRDAEHPAIGTPDDPDARDRWYWEQRALPTGSIPVDVHRAAIQHELSQTRILTSGDAAWENLGPAPVLDINYGDSRQSSSGRALSIAIHPDDPKTILLGTAQGGVWKSTDHGATFRSTHEETLPSLAINVIRFRPHDPNVVYAGTGEPNASTSVYGAGLLRSDDGGETWQTLPSRGIGWDFNYAAITGLHFDARDPSTMYVTTATVMSAVSYPIFRTPPNPPQTGVFRSTDAGQSWTLLLPATRYVIDGTASPSVGFLDFEYGGSAAPDLMIVSELYGGLLKSTNAGLSWTRITPLKPTGLGALPAEVARVSWLDPGAATYSLVDRLPNPDDVPDFRRVEIGMSPADLNILYAGYDANGVRLDMDGNGIWDPDIDRVILRSLLFKSEDGGASWRWLGSYERGVPDYCAGQCGYDNVITVNPEDADDVLIAGSANYTFVEPDPVDSSRLVQLPWRGMIYRSRDGGNTWLDLTPHCTRLGAQPSRFLLDLPVFPCAEASASKVIHPDAHAIVLEPGGAIYVANDGGLYRSSVPQAAPAGRRRAVRSGPKPWPPFEGLSYSWENLNQGLSTLQFYRVASHPTDPNIILGGMQDNACAYWNGEVWDGWGAGDGTVAAFDPKDPRHVYLGYQFGVARHDNGGVKDLNDHWRDLLSNSFSSVGENASFIPVFTLDPVDPSIVYAASTAGLFRSPNRGNVFLRLLPAQTTDGKLTSLSVSPVDHRVVWGGTSNGTLYRYNIEADGTTQITDVSGDLPNRWVSRVAASYASASTVYAVLNGYDANTPERPGKVFVSTDDGASWTNISGELPDVPATAIALDPFDPNRIWIATDIGVFSTSNHGATWTSERRNMPIVGVQDLIYNATTGFLIAATHGRGIWRMPVDAPAPSSRRERASH